MWMKHYYCIFILLHIFETTLDILNKIRNNNNSIKRHWRKRISSSLNFPIYLIGFSIYYRATKQIFYLNSQRRKSVRHFFKDLNLLREKKRQVYKARFKGPFKIFTDLHCRFVRSEEYLVVLWTIVTSQCHSMCKFSPKSLCV